MKVLIEIDDSDYADIMSDSERNLNHYERLIKNGTPLPKGHGRLIDESDLMPDSDYEDGMFYAVSIGAINGAPTIIKADKESED